MGNYSELIKIANKKDADWSQLPKDKVNEILPWEIANNVYYVGREYKKRPYHFPQSDLANPYSVISHGGREKCIQLFRKLLWRQICNYRTTKFDTLLVAGCLYLKLLVEAEQPITLVCHCYPKPCHAEVIRNFILWAIKEGID